MSKYNFISDLCGNYPVSGIRAMFDLAAGYPGAINLCNGEPNFETPKHIVESAVTALREGRTKYGTEPGLPAMRQIVERHGGALYADVEGGVAVVCIVIRLDG